MIVSARVVAEGCSQKKKDPLTGPMLSSDARACDHTRRRAARDSEALLRGQSEQARHALAETPQRLIEPYVLVDVVDGARRHQAAPPPAPVLVRGSPARAPTDRRE